MLTWCNENQGFLSAVLSLATLFLSAYAIFKSANLQRKIHNRDIQLAFQDKVLNIYSVFSECGRLMLFDEYSLQMKMGVHSKLFAVLEAMLKQREIIGRTFDEAQLILGSDEVLIKTLNNIYIDFLSLSKRYLELVNAAQFLAIPVVSSIVEKFPELEPLSLHKILSHPEACEMFQIGFTTPEVEQWHRDTTDYLCKFAYDQFDALFEKHLPIEKM